MKIYYSIKFNPEESFRQYQTLEIDEEILKSAIQEDLACSFHDYDFDTIEIEWGDSIKEAVKEYL